MISKIWNWLTSKNKPKLETSTMVLFRNIGDVNEKPNPGAIYVPAFKVKKYSVYCRYTGKVTNGDNTFREYISWYRSGNYATLRAANDAIKSLEDNGIKCIIVPNILATEYHEYTDAEKELMSKLKLGYHVDNAEELEKYYNELKSKKDAEEDN